jgi:ribokinase
MTKKILVLGSANIDMILRVPRFHKPGETILGEDLMTAFGGKGANQAIAARRLGGNVVFLTRLGKDHHGKLYRQYLVRSGLPFRYLLQDNELPTGMAFIEVNPKGENRIVVSSGANRLLSEGDLRKAVHLWKGVSIFVTQLETPFPTVAAGLKMAKDHDAITLLNPSPAIPLTADTLSLIDFLVPNETEAQLLTGMKGKGQPRKMGNRLLEMGARNIVITLGSEGLFFVNRDEEFRMDAFKVDVQDTTAAGDAFMGGLAWALSEGMPIRKALRSASGAGALAATRMGAQPSLPTRRDLDRFLSAF